MILGIDPGLDGAMAFYCEKSETLANVYLIPTHQNRGLVLADAKREVNAAGVAEIIKPYTAEITAVVIERVHSSPKMGVVSAFRFGETFGLLRGCVAALLPGVNPIFTMPSVWKASLNLSADKRESIALAASTFPDWAYIFRREKKSADLAEAALLAFFGKRFLSQK